MSDLPTQMAILETQMKQISKQVDEGFKANSEEHREIIATFERAMEKKAGKWVEKVLVWVGASIGVVIIGALMSLIITK
jgi:phosphosulfolactate synthase (CoM biosynthesis protein A)